MAADMKVDLEPDKKLKADHVPQTVTGPPRLEAQEKSNG